MQALIDAGADPKAQDKAGATPLHGAAALSNSSTVVKALIDAGADLNAQNKDGKTPLHLAESGNDNPAVVQVLRDASAEFNAQNKDRTPLHRAEENPQSVEKNFSDAQDENIKVFISYSWESEDHKEWVKELAARLCEDGIDVILDQWELRFGDHVTHFMENSIRDSKYVLIICTPTYAKKSNERKGGVGYEDHIITAELYYYTENQHKFIPIFAKDSWNNAAPSWMRGKRYVDLSSNESYKKNYTELKDQLLGKVPKETLENKGLPAVTESN